MRIGLSTSVIQRGRSGVGQYVLSLVGALLTEASRHEITLFVLEGDLQLFDFARNAVRIIPVAERHRPPVRDILWHQARLPGLVRRHGIQVLHVPSYRRMLWPRPCALVATVHDLAPFHLSAKYDRARMFYGRVVARRLARRQDQIIAVSQLTARDLVRFFAVPAEKVTVVPNGLDHEVFRPDPDGRPEEDPSGGSIAPFFLYVARLEHPAKNHVRLIEAFTRFKGATESRWRLLLGGGDWRGAEAVRAAAKASPFSSDINLLGFVPPRELPGLYRSAGALVFPSLFEGFGLPPIEAMACGCPVLSSRRGALAETVGSAAANLEPEDIPQMQAQLSRAASDGPWRSELRAAGLARAQSFNWRTTAMATLAVYTQAIAAHRP